MLPLAALFKAETQPRRSPSFTAHRPAAPPPTSNLQPPRTVGCRPRVGVHDVRDFHLHQLLGRAQKPRHAHQQGKRRRRYAAVCLSFALDPPPGVPECAPRQTHAARAQPQQVKSIDLDQWTHDQRDVSICLASLIPLATCNALAAATRRQSTASHPSNSYGGRPWRRTATRPSTSASRPLFRRSFSSCRSTASRWAGAAARPPRQGPASSPALRAGSASSAHACPLATASLSLGSCPRARQALRDQYIRAKYERKEFVQTPEAEEQRHHIETGYREGEPCRGAGRCGAPGTARRSCSRGRKGRSLCLFSLVPRAHSVRLCSPTPGALNKRGKENNKWQGRYCIVQRSSFGYKIKKDDAAFKGVIELADAQITLVVRRAAVHALRAAGGLSLGATGRFTNGGRRLAGAPPSPHAARFLSRCLTSTGTWPFASRTRTEITFSRPPAPKTSTSGTMSSGATASQCPAAVVGSRRLPSAVAGCRRLRSRVASRCHCSPIVFPRAHACLLGSDVHGRRRLAGPGRRLTSRAFPPCVFLLVASTYLFLYENTTRVALPDPLSAASTAGQVVTGPPPARGLSAEEEP